MISIHWKSVCIKNFKKPFLCVKVITITFWIFIKREMHDCSFLDSVPLQCMCYKKNANALLIWNGKGNGWHNYDWYEKILIPAYFSYHLLWFKRLPKYQYHIKVTRYTQKLNRVSLSASKLVKDLSLCPYMFYQPWQSVISSVEIFYWCCNIGFTYEYLNVLS